MPSPRALRGDERIRNIHDEAKAHLWIARHACWKCGLLYFFVGVGLTLFVVAAVAKHYHWIP